MWLTSRQPAHDGQNTLSQKACTYGALDVAPCERPGNFVSLTQQCFVHHQVCCSHPEANCGRPTWARPFNVSTTLLEFEGYIRQALAVSAPQRRSSFRKRVNLDYVSSVSVLRQMIVMLIDEHRTMRRVICRHLSVLGPVVIMSVTFTHLEVKHGEGQQLCSQPSNMVL